MRTFVALNLSPDRRAELHAAVEPLREALGRAVSWTREPALHLTLKFLDDRSGDFVAQLTGRLAGPLRRLPPIRLEVGGVGAFPSLGRPRVLWVGVAANPDLSRLYQEVESACAALGVPREGRAFHPHVTIGRVRAGARLDAALLTREAEAVRFRTVDRAPMVDVIESVLGPGGARYRVVSALALGGDSEEV